MMSIAPFIASSLVTFLINVSAGRFIISGFIRIYKTKINNKCVPNFKLPNEEITFFYLSL